MKRRITTGLRRFYDNVIYGENVPLDGDEPASVIIDKAARVSFLEFHESLTAWRASQYARTPLGAVESLVGYLLLIGCVVRVALAINNIFHSHSTRQSDPSAGIHRVRRRSSSPTCIRSVLTLSSLQTRRKELRGTPLEALKRRCCSRPLSLDFLIRSSSQLDLMSTSKWSPSTLRSFSRAYCFPPTSVPPFDESPSCSPSYRPIRPCPAV